MLEVTARPIGAVPASGETGAVISPSTVSRIPQETVRERNILHLREVIDLTPGLFTTQGDSQRAPSFTIRASREIPFHELDGGRTGAAFYVDDIPFLDAYGRDVALFALEDLSIYKGPHGTMFGAPGPLGVFDVTSRRPGPELAGDASYTYGSNDWHKGVFHASGPILPGLYFGIDGLYSEDEGWFEDRLTGDAYGKHQTAAGRIQLLWDATEKLAFTLTAGADHHDDDPAIYVPHGTDDLHKTRADPDSYSTGDQAYGALKAVWKEDGWQVKSITSHRRVDSRDSDDNLLVEVFFPGSLMRERDQEISAWTQEIRAESTDPEAPWRWRTGLFFSRSEARLDHFILGLGPWEGTSNMDFTLEDWAAYGELTRALGEHLELSTGLRLQTTRVHSWSDFEPTAFAAGIGGASLELEDTGSFHAVLPMAAAAWKWSAAQRSYFRFSTGTQPGGFRIAANGTRDYDPEDSFHYELGHDSSFRDGTVLLHAAAFYTHYRDVQSFQFNPGGQAIFNAERAHAWGAETEIRVKATEEIELFAGAGFTQARYDEYDSPIGDFSGERIARVPAYLLNVGASYRAKWGGVARIDWRYVGKTYFDEANTVKEPGYSVLDARIGYEKGNFGIYVFGRNLTGTDYFSNSYVFLGQPSSTPGNPRVIGTEIRATF